MAKLARATCAALLSVTAVWSLAGCATPDEGAPHEYLDESTAATLTVVGEPLVFARERSDLAANARDYVTLAAAGVDRGGKVQYVIVAYRWSTIDTRLDPDPPKPGAPLVVLADDRRIELTMPVPSPHDIGIDRPIHLPPGPRTDSAVYLTDLSTLRFLAAARHMTVRAGRAETSPTYELWADGRPALARFIDPLRL